MTYKIKFKLNMQKVYTMFNNMHKSFVIASSYKTRKNQNKADRREDAESMRKNFCIWALLAIIFLAKSMLKNV